MSHVTLTELRQNMASYFDRVAEDREPLVVTRSGGKGNVVIMSEAEFAGWQETVHLLSSARNAARLMESVRQAKASRSQEKILVAPRKRAD
jgi:antitoxin YefM